MTTKTTAKTPLHGLTSCGSCGAPMRHVEATGDHEAMYVCYRKHQPRTIVRLDAHVTDRLVIGGVLAAVLSDTVIAAMQSELMELEEQGGGADAFRAEDMGLVREDPYLFLRAVGGKENARDLLTTFVTRIRLFPDRAVVHYPMPLPPDGTRVTSTVTHTYDDDRDSPYIVRVDLNGFGGDGIGEGTDSLEVAVSHVPTIEVFAGEDRTVAEGAEVDYRASFIRPGELWDYEYRWEFGDGSPTVTGSPDEGKTRIETAHVFADHRPAAYRVIVTVSAMSETGRVSGSDSFSVTVTEVRGFLILGWDIGATAKSALRALLAIISVATRVLIWAGILSPAFIVLGAAIYLWKRFGRKETRPRLPWPRPAGGGPAGGAPPAVAEGPEAELRWPPLPGDEPSPEQAGPDSDDAPCLSCGQRGGGRCPHC